VTLSNDLKKKDFFIFSRKFIETNSKELRNKNGRFSSASHRIVFLEKPSRSSEIMKIDRRLANQKYRNQFKCKWNLIK